ncbi:hypothetical protein V2J91_23755 [Pseudomonas alliivorans]|nr:hypothetical protein [Pseudomonas alliivorans]
MLMARRVTGHSATLDGRTGWSSVVSNCYNFMVGRYFKDFKFTCLRSFDMEHHLKNVFCWGYSDQVSNDLRSKRKITFRLTDSDPLISDYILIETNGIPVWIAEVDAFSVPAGSFPKEVVVSLGQITLLDGVWNEVSQVLGHAHVQHGKTIKLNIDPIVALGKITNSNSEGSRGSLTAQEAAASLAWTYGVKEQQVKISIEF